MSGRGRSWSLATAERARRHLVRLMTRLERGEIDEARFRALVYGFSRLLEYFKFEKELAFEERIRALEERLMPGP